MKVSKSLSVVFFVILTLFLFTETHAEARKVNWKAFSTNLVVAIKSNHPGLQESAMQRIISYADSLDVSAAVYDIALLFRFDHNPRVRRMAMVTLSKINTEHALGYLCQYLKYEKNLAIRNQCCWIISNYYATRNPEKLKELAILMK